MSLGLAIALVGGFSAALFRLSLLYLTLLRPSSLRRLQVPDTLLVQHAALRLIFVGADLSVAFGVKQLV
jgi:hypothetical protein